MLSTRCFPRTSFVPRRWAHPNGLIDLRSDTVTVPTPQMLDAMISAPLGDDVYEEGAFPILFQLLAHFIDPTVRRLEELSANMFGKEAGLFVSSGTQGNFPLVLLSMKLTIQEI